MAFIYGSFARDQQQRTSDIDVMVLGGSPTFGEVVAALNPAQETLGREINPTVYPVGEFHSKLAAQHYFVKTVLKERHS